MSRGFCPTCHQPVRLPSLHRQTRVRCPLCRAEHTAGAFADEGPPTVEVVEGPRTGGAESVPGGTSMPAQEPTVAESPRNPASAGLTRGEESPAIAAEQRPVDAAAQGTALPDTRSSTPTTGEPPRYAFRETLPSPAEMAPLILAAGKHTPRREPGMLSWLVKVLLGGVAGAVLAQLIVWWLPHPYRRDPLNLAPKIPTQVGWLAPDELRWPLPADTAEGDAWLNPTHDPAQPAANAAANAGPAGSGAAGSGAAGGDTADSANTQPAGTATDGNPASSTTTGEARTSSASAANDPTTESPQAAPGAETSGSSPASRRALGLKRGDLYSGVEIVGATTDAQAVLTRWQAAVEPQRTGIVPGWMQTWEALAYRITFVNETDPGVSEPVATIAAMIRKAWSDPSQQEVLLRHQRQVWSDLNAWPEDEQYVGRFLFGKVIEVTPRGPLYRTLLQLAGSDLAVPIYSRVDPTSGAAPAYQLSDTVAILGVVVRNPERDLEGFAGTDRPIVWGGLPVQLNQRATPTP